MKDRAEIEFELRIGSLETRLATIERRLGITVETVDPTEVAEAIAPPPLPVEPLSARLRERKRSVSRRRFRFTVRAAGLRYFGSGLFAVTLLKVVLIDMSQIHGLSDSLVYGTGRSADGDFSAIREMESPAIARRMMVQPAVYMIAFIQKLRSKSSIALSS